MYVHIAFIVDPGAASAVLGILVQQPAYSYQKTAMITLGLKTFSGAEILLGTRTIQSELFDTVREGIVLNAASMRY